MQSINAILFDLDGVLYVGDQVIEGAVETLEYCRSSNIPFRFITNTSTRTAADVADKLNAMGMTIAADEIFSAVTATRNFLLTKGKPTVHLLIRESAQADFHEFDQTAEQPDYIIVGDIGAAWNYALLNQVFRELMSGAELIAMHRNKFWQGEDGLQMDIGAFVAGLEFVSGKQARVIGKPSADFFTLATESLGLPTEEIMIVGDDIENDVGGGQAAGLKGVLVKTGKYRETVAQESAVKPDAVIDSIADLPALLAGD